MTKHPYFRIYWIFFSIALVHLFFILKNSVNIPFMDEWELFRPDSFIMNPTIFSLFKQHNEHKLVIPNLFFFLFYKISGYNVPIIQVFNFSFFVFIALKIQGIALKLKNTSVIFFATLLLLSPLNFENHFWPFQIQWHLVIFFTLVSTIIFFKASKSYFDLLLAFILPFLIVFSLGSGLGVILIQVILFNFFLYLGRNNSTKIDKIFNVIYTFSGLLFVAFYLIDYKKPEFHPEINLPYTSIFWKHLLAQLSLGVNSNESKFFVLGIIPLAFYTHNFIKIIKKFKETKAQSLLIFTLSTIFLGMMSLISLSRSGFGHEQALSSRYFEFSSIFFVLVFSQAISFYDVLPKLIKYIVIPILIITSFKNFNFKKFYIPLNQSRADGFTCAKKIYKDNIGEICKEIYPAEIKSILENLKVNKIKTSFTEDFN